MRTHLSWARVRTLLSTMTPGQALVCACVAQLTSTVLLGFGALSIRASLLLEAQREEPITDLEDPVYVLLGCLLLAGLFLLFRAACSLPALVIGRVVRALDWRQWLAATAGMSVVELSAAPVDLCCALTLGLYATGRFAELDPFTPFWPKYLVVGMAWRMLGAFLISNWIQEQPISWRSWLSRIALLGGAALSSYPGLLVIMAYFSTLIAPELGK